MDIKPAISEYAFSHAKSAVDFNHFFPVATVGPVMMILFDGFSMEIDQHVCELIQGVSPVKTWPD